MRFGKRFWWAREARFAAQTFAKARLFSKTRRRRTLSLVQSADGRGRSRAETYGNTELAGEKDLQKFVRAETLKKVKNEYDFISRIG